MFSRMSKLLFSNKIEVNEDRECQALENTKKVVYETYLLYI